MSPRSPTEAQDVDEHDDGILASRLRSLGYSLSLPEQPQKRPSATTKRRKSALETLLEKVEEDIADASPPCKAGGRTFDASLNFLGDSLFQDSPFETTDAPQVALHLARALQLYPPPLLAIPIDSPLRILSTPRTSLHHPDHVEIDGSEGPLWLWEAEPDVIKVGQRVWVTKGFARHFRILLLEQAVSPGGFAALWNKLYAGSQSEPEASVPDDLLDPSFFDTDSEDATDDEEKSTSRPRSSFFRLTLHHVWRAFVIYSCLLASNVSSRTFTSPPRPSTADLVALANSTLFGSGSLNVHDLSPHHCSTCSKPRRRWLGGPATEAEREKGVLWAGTSRVAEVEEDAIKLPGPPVQLAVCDGTEMGHLVSLAPPPTRRFSTMWTFRRSKTLQTLVAACGAPLAWTTFADGETPASVIDFLSTVHAQWSPDATSTTSRSAFPSYIAYDRSCDVLRSLLRKPASSGDSPLPPFLRSSRLIVTAFHKQSHPQGDAFCDEFCDPTPLDGRAPDLVVPYKPVGRSSKRGPRLRTFERAFNSSAAEQLNSTLSRFAPHLSTLKAENFTFLVHVLLRHRRDEVEKRERAV
uniref:FGENESH: predicted gene_3.622 protein n=1 Tax=Rhodotorula toruloides TaxID=5286 RepID=A0A0K3CCP8_RHOTO